VPTGGRTCPHAVLPRLISDGRIQAVSAGARFGSRYLDTFEALSALCPRALKPVTSSVLVPSTTCQHRLVLVEERKRVSSTSIGDGVADVRQADLDAALATEGACLTFHGRRMLFSVSAVAAGRLRIWPRRWGVSALCAPGPLRELVLSVSWWPAGSSPPARVVRRRYRR
jgi:hypothetical protein